MSANKNKDTCYHCGDHCGGQRVNFDGRVFCCRGCKTVYEVLSDNNLITYYEIEENPGLKKEDQIFSDFSYLDLPEIKKDILSFFDENSERVTLSLPGIHCSSCIWLLEHLNTLNEAIKQSEVNFLKKEVTILYKPKEISLRQVAELLDSIGYKPMIELRQKDRERALKRKNLSYIFKLGVAGFAFGNIMLLSFPEYFEEGMYSDEEFGAFFGYINLILAMPVFFYCSSDYFMSAWKGLKSRYLNIDVPISLGILVLFIRSAYEVISQSGPGFFDSMTGLAFFLLIGKWFQNRTYQALSFERDYKSYFPLGVTKVENGSSRTVLLKDIRVNDELIIHNGEIIPADSTLLSEHANIDYSFVTGEAEPVLVKAQSKLFAGGRQMGEMLRIRVEKEFSQSYLMQLWKQESKSTSEQKELNETIDKVSHYFTAAILLIGLGTFVYWQYHNPKIAFHALSSVLIIACPCALALTIPFTYGNGLRLLEKIGIYLKDARIIERLAAIDTVVFDKTGTITRKTTKSLTFTGETLSPEELSMVKSTVSNSLHPLSRIILNSMQDVEDIQIETFEEVEGKGIKALVKGTEVKIGSASFLEVEENNLASVYVMIGKELKGYYSVGYEYRDGLKEVLSVLDEKYELELITGDGDSERGKLENVFPEDAGLFFKMNPFEKKEHILFLKNKGQKVLMVGDGLNDAGAIKESHVGVSISDDVFGYLPSCDAIIEAKEFNSLSNLLRFSIRLKNLVLAGFLISFAYNLVGLSFAVQGVLSPVLAAILMPLSSISVVSFAIISTKLSSKNIFF